MRYILDIEYASVPDAEGFSPVSRQEVEPPEFQRIEAAKESALTEALGSRPVKITVREKNSGVAKWSCRTDGEGTIDQDSYV